MYEVTIAIPLFNAEQYLNKTMSTALAQTFSSIEFLIIDDQSTDGSLEIIRQLQQEHPRGKDIRIFYQKKNKGVAEARNAAIREATGKYLFFLDSDDLITPECIDLLYRAIEQEQVEVAIASHEHVYTDTEKVIRFQLPSLVGHTPDQLASLRFGELHHVLGFYIWNILYRISFIRDKGLKFKPLHIGEDFVFMYDIIPEIKSFILLSEVTYSYIRRPNSLSQHGKRQIIPLSEIEEQVFIRTYGKKRFYELKNKTYATDMVTNLMKYSFEAAAYIVSNQTIISPKLPHSLLRELLRHPLGLRETMKLRQHKVANLYYLGCSKLPYWIVSTVLTCFLQILKISWKLRDMIH